MHDDNNRIGDSVTSVRPPVVINCALFENLVDIVADDSGGAAYLVKENSELQICQSYEINGIMYVPPPLEKIPFLLPRAKMVLRQYEKQSNVKTSVADEALFDEVCTHLRRSSKLASEAYYLLNTLWVFHTYLQEHADYSPVISMVADAESGKSRTGKAMIHIAFRGVHLETAHQAHIIRLADYFHASLFVDVKNISAKIAATQSEDVFLGRFEKGVKVLRVGKQPGKFVDTELYHVFGPTIIASNAPVDEILETRTIEVPLSGTAKIFDNDLRPQDCLPLKEKLVAFRARYINPTLPDADKPATGRLGDIMRPLRQIVKLIAPKREQDFLSLVDELFEKRRMEKSLSPQAQILIAIDSAKGSINNGVLGVKAITEELNRDKEKNMKLSTQRVGRLLGLIGFDKGKLRNGNSAILYDNKRIKILKEKYGLNE